MKPGSQGVATTDGKSPAGQDEEGGLESVFDVLFIPEAAPAEPEHQRPVAADQGSEGGLIPAPDEPLQQHAVSAR
jgi:hypothetical protein